MPNPGDLARRARTTLTARPVQQDGTPGPRRTPLAANQPFRRRYEHAVRLSRLEPRARLVALTVAAHADYQTGAIPASASVGVDALSRACGLTAMATRVHLHALCADGWMQRTEIGRGTRVQITLTLPAWYQDTP
ncbi:hypothetical protein [Actinacidiphila reveromycinica]|nr:hypothetical protein [Streptomyces sp. SN-593]